MSVMEVAATTLEHRSRAQTYPLLAATGLRVGEALALDRDTADMDAGVLLISRGKGRDPRLVPLHPPVRPLAVMRAGVTSRRSPIVGRHSSSTPTVTGWMPALSIYPTLATRPTPAGI